MPPTVLVIGGGLAGLAAAVRLSAQNYAVTLVERSERLGGRLLCSGTDANHFDAIPPVLMGHHRATLALLKELGTADRASCRMISASSFYCPAGISSA
ncbi:MAG: FAD-dependent oxidoreductase [Nitrospiraceae bacterium]|nr:FAD-dependent oxidoreductase [Nitrospiraceae bacterium]